MKTLNNSELKAVSGGFANWTRIPGIHTAPAEKVIRLPIQPGTRPA